MKCPLLDADGWSRNYELAVLFHTLRNLFQLPGSLDTPWQRQLAPWLPQPAPEGGPGGAGGRSGSGGRAGSNNSSSGGGTVGLVLGHAGLQGRRRSMEDVALLRQAMNLPLLGGTTAAGGASLFGVFDGHAGDAVARFAEEAVPLHLVALLGGPAVARDGSAPTAGWSDPGSGGSGAPGAAWNSSATTAGDLREALVRSFLEVDARALADPALSQSGAGCTACVGCFDPSTDALVLANLGDCRAVLASTRSGGESSGSIGSSSGNSSSGNSSNGNRSSGSSGNGQGSQDSAPPHSGPGWRDLTFDCRADRADEVARVVQRGGFVNLQRVNGTLAVSADCLATL